MADRVCSKRAGRLGSGSTKRYSLLAFLLAVSPMVECKVEKVKRHGDSTFFNHLSCLFKPPCYMCLPRQAIDPKSAINRNKMPGQTQGDIMLPASRQETRQSTLQSASMPMQCSSLAQGPEGQGCATCGCATPTTAEGTRHG
jgi:hypothetical protein